MYNYPVTKVDWLMLQRGLANDKKGGIEFATFYSQWETKASFPYQ
jgi:hypothetical protein